MDVDGFLGATRLSDAEWRFDLGPHLHGAFGGVFGGVLAAASLLVGRAAAPGRTPSALDSRFLRGLPAGQARAEAAVLHDGRSLACVSVDLTDARGRLCTRSTVSLVAPEALHATSHAAPASPSFAPYEDGTPWRRPPGVEFPIVDTLGSRIVASDEEGVANAVRVPWDGAVASAEASCLAADMCTGPPVARAVQGEPVLHPNPDLSLRFCDETAEPVVVGVGRVERVAGGVAVVRIGVYAGADLVAIGLSSSLLVPLPTR